MNEHDKAQNVEIQELKRRVSDLETITKQHAESIRQLFGAQESTRAYVTQILSRIDQFETKVFNLVTQLISHHHEDRMNDRILEHSDRNLERIDRSSSHQMAYELIKWVIGITIGAIVSWFVSNSK